MEMEGRVKEDVVVVGEKNEGSKHENEQGK